MLIFSLIITTMITIIISNKISILEEKKDFGIMLVNGYTKRNIYNIILVENMIKCIISITVVIIYWILQYIKCDDEFTKTLIRFIFKNNIIIMLTVSIIICITSVILIKKEDLYSLISDRPD